MSRFAVHFVDVAARSGNGPERTFCDRAGVSTTYVAALTTCARCQRLLALAAAQHDPTHPWSPVTP